MHRSFYILLIFLATSLSAYAQNEFFRIKNLISSYSSLSFNDPAEYILGGRYIPTINLSANLKKGRSIDAELSVNASLDYYFKKGEVPSAEKDIEPYRGWIRYSSPRFELRAGLQKISFGSASILRPLMWFDKMDYRDPLQLTPGVYSLLGKYYFQSNINIWFWALYGNNDTKGWEVVPTQDEKVEYGGRFQVPLPSGELALSYHHRSGDYSLLYLMNPQITEPFFDDRLIGVDGKWDIGPGISIEYVYKLNDPDNYLMEKEEHYLNLGMDYTFNLGSGLNVVGEYFRYKGADTDNYAALALSYPFGLMNSVMLAIYYNTDKEDVYSLITLKRDYNYLSLNLLAYWNPAEAGLYTRPGDKNMLAGKGIQVMAVLNF